MHQEVCLAASKMVPDDFPLIFMLLYDQPPFAWMDLVTHFK